MSTSLKLYVKMFFLFGIPYGLLMALFDYVLGIGFSWQYFVLMTVIFGGIMSLMLVTYHVSRLKRTLGEDGISDNNVGVNHTRKYTSKLSFADVVNEIKSHPKFAKSNFKYLDNGISFTTTATMQSWGEVINIIPDGEQEGEYWYKISSRPYIPTTLLDYGKNLQNVKMLGELIS